MNSFARLALASCLVLAVGCGDEDELLDQPDGRQAASVRKYDLWVSKVVSRKPLTPENCGGDYLTVSMPFFSITPGESDAIWCHGGNEIALERRYWASQQGSRWTNHKTTMITAYVDQSSNAVYISLPLRDPPLLNRRLDVISTNLDTGRAVTHSVGQCRMSLSSEEIAAGRKEVNCDDQDDLLSKIVFTIEPQ